MANKHNRIPLNVPLIGGQQPQPTELTHSHMNSPIAGTATVIVPSAPGKATVVTIGGPMRIEVLAGQMAAALVAARDHMAWSPAQCAATAKDAVALAKAVAEELAAPPPASPATEGGDA